MLCMISISYFHSYNILLLLLSLSEAICWRLSQNYLKSDSYSQNNFSIISHLITVDVGIQLTSLILQVKLLPLLWLYWHKSLIIKYRCVHFHSSLCCPVSEKIHTLNNFRWINIVFISHLFMPSEKSFSW